MYFNQVEEDPFTPGLLNVFIIKRYRFWQMLFLLLSYYFPCFARFWQMLLRSIFGLLFIPINMFLIID